MAFIHRREGEQYRAAATFGFPPDFWAFMQDHPIIAGRGSIAGRVALERHAIQIEDVAVDPEYTLSQATSLARQHTTLGVPLLRENELIGVIVLARQRVELFTEKQIALVTTFADQAVIAIENARLFDEVQAKTHDIEEALRYQTGSANILNVIASSPTDVQPVLNAIVESACELCEAYDAIVVLKNGDELELRAHHGPIPMHIQRWANDRTSLSGRAIADRRPVHVKDVLSDEGVDFPMAQRMSSVDGCRTLLSAPMLREGEPIGTIVLRRVEPHPFSDKQIALLQTFADQAVIALGNVRLFEEVQARTHDLQESLQQQTATAEVLEVINASPGNLAPVFDAMLEKAIRLCDAVSGHFRTYDGKSFPLASVWGEPEHVAATRLSGALVPGPNHPVSRFLRGDNLIHLPDARESEEYRADARFRALVDRGVLSVLAVALRKDGRLFGYINVYRHVAEPFTDRQIALLQNFSSQAVIAMENARLFDELQARTRDVEEALRYQTGSANILNVIASSPTDVEPALQAIVESACKLCDAYDANVLLKIGDDLHFSAHHGPIPTGTSARPISREWVAGRSVVDKTPVQVPDFWAPEAAEFPEGQRQSREQGHRCTLSVPLLREGEAIGAIALRRVEPIAFSDKQIALLQTFADQAVIALGNVRLFEEVQARTRDLQESLQQQTATADVLKVISRSAFDLQAVLHTLVESAARLCGADQGTITRQKDGKFYRTEAFGHSPEFMDYVRNIPVALDRGSASGRALLAGDVVHITDVLADPEYTFNEAQRLSGLRTCLGVPVLREGSPVGVLSLTRSEVRPFSDSRSNWSRRLPTKPRSRLKMPGCSKKCRPRRAISRNRSSNRPRPPTC
jgi:GAF domain-containing protein